MSKKIYLSILKYGSLLAFVSLFLVSKYLLFPYVSTKQIFFNILIEVLAVVWLAFIYRFPQYRPKRSWITWGFLAYLGAILLSTIFSVDFNLSFWGDIERMLGFFQLTHFFVFYLIIITAFRERRDWDLAMLTVILTGIGISIASMAGKPTSTLGNQAYVAGYLIFSIYFALVLFFRNKDYSRWLYLAGIALMLPGFIRAGISGAYVGLGFSVLMFFLIFGLLQKKAIRKKVLAIFILGSVLTVLVFTFKEAPLLRDIRPLQEISLQKVTFQTRLISWRAAIKDFPNHPLIGTGYGNFAITFDKNFSPDFYSYTKTETYFDRAHNNVIDIASTSGLVGLLSYLSILAALIFYLFRALRQDKVSPLEFSLLFSLLIAYFVQNLAIFDSLATYLALIVLLGYVHFKIKNDGQEEGGSVKERKGGGVILIVGLVAMFLFPIMKWNVEPLQMMKASVMGHMGLSQGYVEDGMVYYHQAYEYNTPLNRDSQSNFVQLVSSNYEVLSHLTPEILDFTIAQAEKNVQYNTYDTILQLQLSRILNVAARYYSDQPELLQSYAQRALDSINKAIESSPGRVDLYFSKAQIQLTLNDMDGAIQTLRYAQELNPDYYDSYCHLGKVLFSRNQADQEAKLLLDICIDNGLARLLEPSIVKGAINMYVANEDITRVIELYEQLIAYEPQVTQYWINLSKLYAQAGRSEDAILIAHKVVEMEPSLQDEVNNFITTVNSVTIQ